MCPEDSEMYDGIPTSTTVTTKSHTDKTFDEAWNLLLQRNQKLS